MSKNDTYSYAASGRYSLALYELAEESKSVNEIESQSSDLIQLIEKSEESKDEIMVSRQIGGYELDGRWYDGITTDEKKVSEELDVPFYLNFEEIINKVDAVSIAVPTVHHYKSAKVFLANGVHVLLEKPFTEKIEEAEELARLSSDNNVCLQIGHLERFNPVFVGFQQLIDQPKFIENIRIAPFPKRGTDVDVILDLMIHDIDLVLAAVGEFPETVEGIGVKFVTSSSDLAKARLRFPSGCIADLTASRISDKAERKMRIFQSGLYLSLDYVSGKARKLKINSSEIIKRRFERIVISPGPGNPNQSGNCLKIVKEFHNKLPILGVCLGHQIIGQVFGSKIIQAKKLMHGKTSRIRSKKIGILKNLPKNFEATRYHSLIIDKKTLSKDLEITAETKDGLIMGVKHKKHNVHGVQFHPESIKTKLGIKILKNFIRFKNK